MKWSWKVSLDLDRPKASCPSRTPPLWKPLANGPDWEGSRSRLRWWRRQRWRAGVKMSSNFGKSYPISLLHTEAFTQSNLFHNDAFTPTSAKREETPLWVIWAYMLYSVHLASHFDLFHCFTATFSPTWTSWIMNIIVKRRLTARCRHLWIILGVCHQ